MKFFVTDAQLAAMQAQTEQRMRDTFTAWYAEIQKGRDAEIQRLREDRAMELARVTDPSAPFLAHLVELVAILRRDVVHERQRAEVAIDVCRVSHQNVNSVTLPPRDERLPREFPASAEQALAALDIDGLP